jgi:lysophospholipase L1-like esterase
MRGPSAKVVAHLLLAVGSAGATLAVIEAAIRFAGVAPLYFNPRNTCLQRSADLGVELSSSCSGRLAATVFRTNGVGLRGPEVHDDGSYRILAIGDSCTWGYQVGDAETYPAVLQRLLDGRAAGRYQVLNGGVPGYTSLHGLRWMFAHGLALAPRIVIVGFGFNDSLPGGDIEEELARARRRLPLLHLDDALMSWSALYRWARIELAMAFRRRGQAPGVTVDKYRDNLRQLVALIRAHDARPVILDWSPWLRAYHEADVTVANELGVPLLVYEGNRVDVIHPDAAGYAAFAVRLRDDLTRDGYLPF